MAKDNRPRRRVFRQSWKPNKLLSVLHGLWVALYSVIKIGIGALMTVLAIAAICIVVFVGTLADYLENDILPNAATILDNVQLNKTSYIYFLDEKGDIQILQELHTDSKQQWVSYEDIPDALIHAAVAIEDKRFFEHQGVDWITTIKACAGMFMGSSNAGGSSITQQMIKNVLLTEDERADDVTVQRKLMEILRAIELEKDYDKTVIMEYYLNIIFLGNKCNGVKTAAATYFGKELEYLTVPECAALVSITNNPSKYNPYRTKLDDEGLTGMEQLMNRRNTTLHQMYVQGYITEEEYNVYKEEPIVLKRGIDPGDKVADCLVEGCGYHGKVSTFTQDENGVYYCPQCGNAAEIGTDASESVYSWFVDTVLEDVAMAMAERDGVEWTDESKDIYKNLVSRGGYHIYSTIDMEVQEQVDKIYEDLTQIPTAQSLQQLQSAIVVIDNETGDIVAMAGGVGEKEVHDAFNRATDSELQPGSSIKPLSVYAPAFELGYYTPATVITDLPLQINGTKPFPRNDDYKYRLSHTVLDAMTDSVNAVAVNLLDSIGLTYSYNFAKEKFGLSKLTNHYVNSAGTIFSDESYAPLGLGAPTIGVSVREMAEAYGTFSNQGVRREGRTYTKVYNSEGNLVMDNTQTSERIISEKTTNYINYCLDNAVNSGTGTAADLKSIGIDVAGKTGSTSSFKDRWFCGYTNYYTAAVWCGYDIPEVITLTGSNKTNPACRLWKKVMEPLHKGLDSVPLYDDMGMYEVSICLDCGKIATDVCEYDARDISRVSKVMVYDEDIPTEECDCHIFVDYCEDCDAVANEYCKKLAAVGKAKVTRKALVKTDEGKVNDIAEAIDKGLTKSYSTDKYIYLVDSEGNPMFFYGFDGTKNEGLNQPYIVATGHTVEDWQKYLNSQGIQQIASEEEP